MPGACRQGDLHLNPSDCHGCPGCCHCVVGTANTHSPDTFDDGRGVFRGSAADMGTHCCCCGPNIWGSIECSPDTFVNGIGWVRNGDLNWCCGGVGWMITASGDTFVN